MAIQAAAVAVATLAAVEVAIQEAAVAVVTLAAVEVTPAAVETPIDKAAELRASTG